MSNKCNCSLSQSVMLDVENARKDFDNIQSKLFAGDSQTVQAAAIAGLVTYLFGRTVLGQLKKSMPSLADFAWYAIVFGVVYYFMINQ